MTAARTAVEAGDRATALSEITAALDLDHDFLAAQALRDRILSMGTAVAPPPPRRVDATSTVAAPSTSIPPPARSALPAGYAQFEQRARRRRVDRRIDAARLALDQRRLRPAAAALNEVVELDPNLPELVELTARFDELRRAAARPHRGPWLAAAAVFAVALFGASWLQDSSPIIFSRQIISAAPLPDPSIPTTIAERLAVEDTTSESIAAPARAPIDVAPRVFTPPAAPSHLPVYVPRPAVEQAEQQPAPMRLPEAPRQVGLVAEAPRLVAEAPAVVPVSTPMPAKTPVPPRVESPDDTGLVKQVLQRYRTAYEGLDARSARAVWPAVNEAALARAFDGLESQSLTFEACDVRLRGEDATAICRGSARYVPKIGNRDPRVEPRVWSFTLRKAAGDWKIDSARAER